MHSPWPWWGEKGTWPVGAAGHLQEAPKSVNHHCRRFFFPFPNPGKSTPKTFPQGQWAWKHGWGQGLCWDRRGWIPQGKTSSRDKITGAEVPLAAVSVLRLWWLWTSEVLFSRFNSLFTYFLWGLLLLQGKHSCIAGHGLGEETSSHHIPNYCSRRVLWQPPFCNTLPGRTSALGCRRLSGAGPSSFGPVAPQSVPPTFGIWHYDKSIRS